MATAAASSAVLKAILPPKTTKVPRTSNTTVCVPVVYGSIAFWLGKKAYEYQTHRWTLYVRGPKGEDLSYAISKVAFHLHPSFAQPIREITSPPFEVTETGWGEFEANIRIFFKDETEKCQTVKHAIRLYPAGTNSTNTNSLEPVVSEVYDEVVFTNPTELFYSQLTSSSACDPSTVLPNDLDQHWPVISDAADVGNLVRAQEFIDKELASVKDRLLRANCELSQVVQASSGSSSQ